MVPRRTLLLQWQWSHKPHLLSIKFYLLSLTRIIFPKNITVVVHGLDSSSTTNSLVIGSYHDPVSSLGRICTQLNLLEGHSIQLQNFPSSGLASFTTNTATPSSTAGRAQRYRIEHLTHLHSQNLSLQCPRVIFAEISRLAARLKVEQGFGISSK